MSFQSLKINKYGYKLNFCKYFAALTKKKVPCICYTHENKKNETGQVFRPQWKGKGKYCSYLLKINLN